MNGRSKILVIKLGALGDFIQALGPMAAIRRHHKDADITLLTTEPFANLGRSCGYFNHVLTDGRPRWHNLKGWLELRAKLNGGYFSRVYDLQNNGRTEFYLKLIRPRPEWVGAAKGASHRNDSPSRTAGNAWEGHIQTLRLAGIEDVALDDLSWISGSAERFNLPRPCILLIPGSAPGRPEKRWPAKNFGTLARIIDGWGFTPVILGTAGEADLASSIRAVFPRAVDLTGQTSLADIVLLARQAAASIGNDTGPMHLIAATGCPSYVLFSRHSNPARHAPIGAHVKTIQANDLADLSPEQLVENLHARDFRKTDQKPVLSGR